MRRVRGLSPYEDVVGYSRAVVLDDGRVLLAGTTAGVDGAAAHPGDGYGQMRQALRTVEAVLREVGTDLAHVVRTRMYVTGPEHCEGAGKAHQEVFADVRPVATMLVVAALIHPDMVAEVEVEAVLP